MAQTRKATELDAKLQATLLELKKCQAECIMLRQENDESADQFQHLLQRNSVLKNQVSAMESRIEEVYAERTHLQNIIASSNHCRETYEVNLERTSFLEKQLAEAKEDIKSLQAEKQLAAFVNTSALYEEMGSDRVQSGNNQTVDSNLDLLADNSIVPTIDLTATPTSSNKRASLSGSNKIKKYVKLSKFIKKSENIVKKQKNIVKDIPIRQQKLDLKVQLMSCQDTIKCNKKVIKELQDKICSLQSELQSISSRYELSKNTIKEYNQAVHKLIEEKNLCKCSWATEKQAVEASLTDNTASAAASIMTESELLPETSPPIQASLEASQIDSTIITNSSSSVR
ncbi:uncharacterized protein LOC135309898 [Plodia interpunctella]|uniref:uncharacterized protein LOC135309898 n=1 Tax=Plodia interpunctella TaxID=58824 RepID=UPI003101A2E7